MADGLQYLLTACIQDAELHPKGWEWYVDSSERLHQDILQLLFNTSPAFSRELTGFSGKCRREPSLNGAKFDLALESKTGNCSAYFEIKVDTAQGRTQFSKQADAIRKEKAAGHVCAGYLVALSYQAHHIKAPPSELKLLTCQELCRALQAARTEALRDAECPPGRVEFIDGYRYALEEQQKRVSKVMA